MIYQMNNKYYIRVAPMKYTEVKFVLHNNDVVIKTTQNRVLSNSNMTFKELNFQTEKDKIKASLLAESNNNSEVKQTNTRSSKHRRRA